MQTQVDLATHTQAYMLLNTKRYKKSCELGSKCKHIKIQLHAQVHVSCMSVSLLLAPSYLYVAGNQITNWQMALQVMGWEQFRDAEQTNVFIFLDTTNPQFIPKKWIKQLNQTNNNLWEAWG